MTEMAVALELGFGKPLIARGLVRKFGMASTIGEDVGRQVFLGAWQGRLDVYELPLEPLAILRSRIVDRTDREGVPAEASGVDLKRRQIDPDIHTEIHPAF